MVSQDSLDRMSGKQVTCVQNIAGAKCRVSRSFTSHGIKSRAAILRSYDDIEIQSQCYSGVRTNFVRHRTRS